MDRKLLGKVKMSTMNLVLETGGSCFLGVNPMEAHVPTEFQVVQPDGRIRVLALQFGYNLPTPTDDLHIDESGVRATLSFNRTPFECSIPWHSVITISDGEFGSCMFAPGDDEPAYAPEEPTKPKGGLRLVK